jgi:hypothetical protein
LLASLITSIANPAKAFVIRVTVQKHLQTTSHSTKIHAGSNSICFFRICCSPACSMLGYHTAVTLQRPSSASAKSSKPESRQNAKNTTKTPGQAVYCSG